MSRMHTRLLMIVSALLAVCGAPSPHVDAEVPHLIRYQGQVVDSQGAPLQGPYDLKIRLYDAETAGTLRWEELHPKVPIDKGHFSLLLGNGTPPSPLDGINWDQPLWLAVQVNDQPELTPRQRITSVPLAITAEKLAVPVTTSTITDDANRLVPSGAIILWGGAACPTGYTRLATYDNKFLFASATVGTEGGSNTHDHGGATGGHALMVAELPSHTHRLGRGDRTSPAAMRGLGSDNVYGFQDATVTEATGGGGGHTHPISTADNRPAFKTIFLCKKD